MSEILLCRHPLNSEALEQQCGINIDQISAIRCTRPTTMAANTPYLVGTTPSATDLSILSQLSPTPVVQRLTDLSLTYGGDNLTALAEINAKLRDYNIGLIGASTSVYAHRMGGFAGSVKDYQSALMEYRQAATSSSPLKAAAKQRAHTAFQKMQSQFRNELKAITARTKARRGTPLTNINRATNIADSSRHVAKLNVMSQVEAHNLVKLSKQTKLLGNGLAVIDFGSRVGNIQNSYQSGGHWERDLFIESSSFALSALAGTAVAKTGAAALSFIMIATPVGWFGLIVGGITIVGVAAAASVGMNHMVKEDAGSAYDSIMRLMDPL